MTVITLTEVRADRITCPKPSKLAFHPIHVLRLVVLVLPDKTSEILDSTEFASTSKPLIPSLGRPLGSLFLIPCNSL